MLHRQILLSLAITVIAEIILMRTSAEQVPSLHRVVPRYSKLVTPNIWPFMLIFTLMFFVLLVMILLFFCTDFHGIEWKSHEGLDENPTTWKLREGSLREGVLWVCVLLIELTVC